MKLRSGRYTTRRADHQSARSSVQPAIQQQDDDMNNSDDDDDVREAGGGDEDIEDIAARDLQARRRIEIKWLGYFAVMAPESFLSLYLDESSERG